MGETTRGRGVPIPEHIADQLRGRNFSSFRKFREALWAAIANDPDLQKQFTGQNKLEMSQGRAPYARAEDQAGDNKKFEVHHPHEIAHGGAVYDIDNMLIMTPRRHIEHHQRKANEN
ncbi:HNH endonuclease:S-type Pyocin [Pseudomonas sp. StFLB209]|nr:HNH endonuclease:S-type Pyocin [Pseudomonas sp. StFLB209]